VTIRRGDLRSPEAQTLIAALNAELSAAYPEPGATHFRLDADEVAEGRGAFLIVMDGDRPVGIKRMYVVPEKRGGGLGQAILDALEGEARALGLTRLLLETGIRQTDAIALYERAGFKRIPSFGEYIASPTSVCMAKEL
jgi:GNAT superfamily N-acetyltransferase